MISRVTPSSTTLIGTDTPILSWRVHFPHKPGTIQSKPLQKSNTTTTKRRISTMGDTEEEWWWWLECSFCSWEPSIWFLASSSENTSMTNTYFRTRQFHRCQLWKRELHGCRAISSKRDVHSKSAMAAMVLKEMRVTLADFWLCLWSCQLLPPLSFNYQ